MSLFTNPSPFSQNSQNQQSQPQSTNSLFGASTNNQQSSAPSSLFGNTATTNTSSSLFGNPQASVPASHSLFANTTNNNSNNNQSSSLFGGNNNQSGGGGGLFGGSSQQQNKPGLTLWGNSTNQNQQQSQPQPSIFSNSTQQQQQAQNSIFSNTNNPARPSLLPSLSLGQSNTNPTHNQGQSQSQQTVPGVRIDLSNLRGTTRFTDLHDDIQAQITQLDSFFAQQVAYCDQINAMMLPHASSISTLSPDVEYIRSRVDAIETALDNDGAAIKSMKGVVAQDAEDARRSFRAVENLKLPQQFHYLRREGNVGATSTLSAIEPSFDDSNANMDLIGYFEKTAADMSATLATYTDRLAEIEQHMRGIESAAVAQGQAVLFKRERSGEEQVRELAAVLREFEGGILGVAGKVGSVREGVSAVVNDGAPSGHGNGGKR